MPPDWAVPWTTAAQLSRRTAAPARFSILENYYPRVVAMMARYPNLYGDTAILANLTRWRAPGPLEP